MRWREGYTLLELLTVLAILGIIAGAFFLALMPQIRAQRLHEVGVTLAGELKRARTQAQKSGADVLVSWNAGSFNTHVSGTTGADRVVNLPEGTRIITPTPAPGALGYEAPHGTAFNGAEPGGFVLTLEGPDGRRLDVAAQGITGMPKVRAQTGP